MLGAAAEGGMPDVFWMHSNNFVDFAKKGLLMDCTSLYDKANFPEGLSQVFQWDGKQLGVPKDFDTIVLVYNKDLFDKAGVKYPDDTWNWDTLVDAATKLTQGDVYGFAASAGEDQSGYLNIIYQAGGYTVRFGEKKSGYTDPKTIQGVQFWLDLQKKYKVSPTQEQLTEMSHHDYFKTCKAAMVFLGSWEIKGYIAAMEELGQKFDIAVMPVGPTGTRATIYNGLTYAGYEGTKLVGDNAPEITDTQTYPIEAEEVVEEPVYGVQQPGNLAFEKPACVSSTETQYTNYSKKAVDGDTVTRWSSEWNKDPSWISVDLEEAYDISRVKLTWESSYAREYKLQVSLDNTTWADVYETSKGRGKVEEITFTPVLARYVRVYMTKRALQWGYSLYEVEVYQ